MAVQKAIPVSMLASILVAFAQCSSKYAFDFFAHPSLDMPLYVYTYVGAHMHTRACNSV
jgi:hypothetical protein